MQAHVGHASAPPAGLHAAGAGRPATPPSPMLEVGSLVLGYGTGTAFTAEPAGVGALGAFMHETGFLRAQPGRLDGLPFRL